MAEDDIIFKASIGDTWLNVNIYKPNGTGGNTWFIIIDKYHHGAIFYTEHFGWQWDDHIKKNFTIDDIQILIELIQEKHPRQKVL